MRTPATGDRRWQPGRRFIAALLLSILVIYQAGCRDGGQRGRWVGRLEPVTLIGVHNDQRTVAGGKLVIEDGPEPQIQSIAPWDTPDSARAALKPCLDEPILATGENLRYSANVVAAEKLPLGQRVEVYGRLIAVPLNLFYDHPSGTLQHDSAVRPDYRGPQAVEVALVVDHIRIIEE